MVDIGLDFWLTQWDLEPSIIIGTVLITGLYLYVIGPFRKRHFPDEPIRRGQTIAFLSGVLIMFLALVSPLDELGDSYLFSAHMLQHLCLTILGPPLLLIGTPEWMVKPVLSNKVVFHVAKVLTYPVVAFVLFNVDFFLWHAPLLYNATLENQSIHIFEHITFIFFSLCYWWPIFSPSKDLPPLSFGGQILYLFLSGMPSVLLGAGLTFSPPLYAPYIAAPRIWGISAATDQQLGGLIMWVPVSIFYIVIMSVLFIRWMLQQEAKQQAKERELYEQQDSQDQARLV
ncbi:MAG TPA: cytochrome c oxidase assembly protein [Ktedonobacteraceae bacterium]|nr:cytochrome c oxidase assembly protein [Ktedonobacteraceae bacterium]